MVALLAARLGTDPATWDADDNLRGLPGARVLALDTGRTRNQTPADRITRTLPAEPATPAAFDASRFRRAVEVIADPDERTFLQRRLGAALGNRPAGDSLIVLKGDGGSGKGSLLTGLRAAFGT